MASKCRDGECPHISHLRQATGYLEYANVPHSAVEFEIASNVNTGISSPEKNATLSVCPVT